MIESGADIAARVAEPLANNLGMIGLIVVLCLFAITSGFVFIIIKLLENNKEIHNNGREDAKLGREALEKLTNAIVLSKRISD